MRQPLEQIQKLQRQSMKYHIPIQNQLSYRSIPRNKDLALTIDHHCNFPSRTLVVDTEGHCFVCACEAWLPITIGNIGDFNHLSDIWNGPVAKSLQQDIDQKKFTNCAVDRCGVLVQDIKLDYYYISINIDQSCNLHCPSCRPNSVMLLEGAEYQRKVLLINHLITLLENFEPTTHITMSGNGDPLASNIMRLLLHQWRPRPNHTIRLFTNGLLLEKQLTNNDIVNNITQYFISIDAGSTEVYENVRRPGRFDNLLKNFDFLRKLVDQTNAEVLLKFVLQAANYNDMQNFVDLVEKYRFNGVINRLEDWGTWDKFTEQDVIGNINHPNHQQAVINLRDIYKKYKNRIQFNPSLASIACE